MRFCISNITSLSGDHAVLIVASSADVLPESGRVGIVHDEVYENNLKL